MNETIKEASATGEENSFAEAMKDVKPFGEHLSRKEKSWHDFWRENPEEFHKLEDALDVEIHKGINNDSYEILRKNEKISHYGEPTENLGIAFEAAVSEKKDGSEEQGFNICWALLEKNERGDYWKHYSRFGVYVPLGDFSRPEVMKNGADEQTINALEDVANVVANMGVNDIEGFKKAVQNGRLGNLGK